MGMYLASEGERAGLWLVDGDGYEEKNRSRMRYQNDGNKALSKAAELSQLAEHDNSALTIVPTPAFVTPSNVRLIVEEHDIVFLCVDNHSTRRTVSRRCRKLDNVLLISGGNDGGRERKKRHLRPRHGLSARCRCRRDAPFDALSSGDRASGRQETRRAELRRAR